MRRFVKQSDDARKIACQKQAEKFKNKHEIERKRQLKLQKFRGRILKRCRPPSLTQDTYNSTQELTVGQIYACNKDVKTDVYRMKVGKKKKTQYNNPDDCFVDSPVQKARSTGSASSTCLSGSKDSASSTCLAGSKDSASSTCLSGSKDSASSTCLSCSKDSASSTCLSGSKDSASSTCVSGSKDSASSTCLSGSKDSASSTCLSGSKDSASSTCLAGSTGLAPTLPQCPVPKLLLNVESQNVRSREESCSMLEEFLPIPTATNALKQISSLPATRIIEIPGMSSSSVSVTLGSSDASTRSQTIWSSEFYPKSMRSFIGNRKAVAAVLKWLQSSEWKKKPLFFSGPNGCGKSVLSVLALREKGYEVVDVMREEGESIASLSNTDASFHVCDRVRDVVSFGTRDGTLRSFLEDAASSKPQALLVDDVHTLSEQDRTKVLSSIFVKEKVGRTVMRPMTLPIIFTCEDPYDKCIRSLKCNCKCVNMYSHNERDMMTMFIRVQKKYPAVLGNDAVIKQCNGDMRKMLNMVQFSSRSKGRGSTIHGKSQTVYRSPFDSASAALSDPSMTLLTTRVQRDRNLVLSLIRQNYTKFFERPMFSVDASMSGTDCLNALATAADIVSQSDIMAEKHMNDFEDVLLACSVGTLEKPVMHQTPRLNYPTEFASMGSARAGRQQWQMFGNVYGDVNERRNMSGWSSSEKYMAAKLLMTRSPAQIKDMGFEAVDIKDVFSRVKKFSTLVGTAK
jgi:DNA polymerase III delta prime subunit